ncbi:MAG: hypothetical protein Q9O62_08620 [Ardenticatenia bacterium]|nr:hypothetical protein [Ardenticatenia bacterium]
MMTRPLKWRRALFVSLASFLFFTVALAQRGFDLPWWTVDGGGSTVSGGPYALSGTLGQPDAGPLNGGAYSLVGGFWGPLGAPPVRSTLYLPLVIRQR